MTVRLSFITLAIGSIIVTGLGLYFVFLRPPLLPEDLRYLGRTLTQVEVATPALSTWLRHVFWVMGGYMIATGLVTMYVALTAFRARTRGAAAVVALAGAASVGGMALVNFLIASDFKWPLLVLALLWPSALVLYGLEGRQRRSTSGGTARVLRDDTETALSREHAAARSPAVQ